MACAEAGLNIEMIYNDYGAMIFSRLKQFFPEDDLEDLFQAVLLRVVEKQHTFAGRSCVSTWLYQLTTRFAINHLRQSRRRQELWSYTRDIPWAQPISAPRQEGKVLVTELSRKLDPELFTIGVYYHLNGLSQNDIAQITGYSRRKVGGCLERLAERAQILIRDPHQRRKTEPQPAVKPNQCADQPPRAPRPVAALQ